MGGSSESEGSTSGVVRGAERDGLGEARGGDGSPVSLRRTPADRVAEELRWVEAHCRFVRTNLPRGELGVSFAEELLAALPDACRRRVPDLTGTAPELLKRAVEFGLLTEVPSARVVRAVPRLIAGLTPLMQLGGSRHWTLWIVHLLDPGMQAKIRRRTPASQLVVCGPDRSDRPRSRAELAVAYRELRAAHAEDRKLVAELHREKAELETTLREADNAIESMVRAQAELWTEEKITRISAVAKKLAADVVKVQSDLITITNERAAAYASLDEMRVELDRAKACLGEERAARERTEIELRRVRAALGQERAARERAEAELGQAQAALGQERTAREQAVAELGQTQVARREDRAARERAEAELVQAQAALEQEKVEAEQMRVSREEALTDRSEGQVTLALFAGAMEVKFQAMAAEIAGLQRWQQLAQVALDRVGAKLIGLGFGRFVEQVEREGGVVIAGR